MSYVEGIGVQRRSLKSPGTGLMQQNKDSIPSQDWLKKGILDSASQWTLDDPLWSSTVLGQGASMNRYHCDGSWGIIVQLCFICTVACTRGPINQHYSSTAGAPDI